MATNGMFCCERRKRGYGMKSIKMLAAVLLLVMLIPNVAMAQNSASQGGIVDTSDHIYSYPEMMEDIGLLGAKYPELIQVSSIGTSLDNRMIFQIVMGNPNAQKAIYVQAATHAREWMNTWIMMKSLEVCLDNWNQMLPNGETYGQIFNDCCIYFVPMVNPDGVSISQFGFEAINNIDLRNYAASLKRDGEVARWKANARGVDINRQYSVGWNSKINHTEPWSADYNGVAPFTEPEAIAVKNALEQREFVAAITYHSTEGAIYWDLGQQGELRERTWALAVYCSNITGYRISSDCSPLKGLEYNYMIFEKGIPTICVETGTVYCPLPYSQWNQLWNENQMMMVAMAAAF